METLLIWLGLKSAPVKIAPWFMTWWGSLLAGTAVVGGTYVAYRKLTFEAIVSECIEGEAEMLALEAEALEAEGKREEAEKVLAEAEKVLSEVRRNKRRKKKAVKARVRKNLSKEGVTMMKRNRETMGNLKSLKPALVAENAGNGNAKRGPGRPAKKK